MEWSQKYWIYSLGFFAQGLFGARLIVQLILSERQGRVVSPTVFWQLSLGASFLFLVYGILRNDAVIIFGQTISYFIYIRNLQLKNSWRNFPILVRAMLLLLPFVAIGWVMVYGETRLNSLLNTTDLTHPIILIGAAGQLMLNFRFIYQWYFSEKENESLLPLGFWVISTVASVMVLVYASYRLDPVLLVAQGLGIIVYIRNMLIYRNAHRR